MSPVLSSGSMLQASSPGLVRLQQNLRQPTAFLIRSRVTTRQTASQPNTAAVGQPWLYITTVRRRKARQQQILFWSGDSKP
jgi:hypothetical protein